MTIFTQLEIVEDKYDELLLMTDNDYDTSEYWTNDIIPIGGAYLSTALDLYEFTGTPTRLQALEIVKQVYLSILPIAWGLQ